MRPNDGGAFAPRYRRDATVSVHLLTWDYAVLLIERPGSAPVYAPRPADGLADFLEGVERGEADRWLAEAATSRPKPVLRRVGHAIRTSTTRSIGIEHEYTVLRAGQPIDFGQIIHDLGIEGFRGDPGDANAYRCDWGGVITSDGIEAEVATPPISLGRRAVADAVASANAGRDFLARHLGPEDELRGFSTHLSITAPERGATRRAVRYSQTFAPGLMLLLERSDSQGILVRPRPNRLELCGDFAEHDRLAIALTYALATTVALVARPTGYRDLEVDTKLTPSRQRFGHYLAPDAFGDDLYRHGRATQLVRRSRRGSPIVTAQRQLEQTWERTRPHATHLLEAAAIDAVDDVVGATQQLPAAVPVDELE